MNIEQQKKRMRSRGICVVIPTYNNAATLRNVVLGALAQCSDVIVVNDGSTDDTAHILSSIEGITVVSYQKNRGKGHALKCGFKKALSMGFAYAITIDSDGQHFADDIPLFVEANIAHPGCLIIGNRQMEGAVRTKGSTFANKFSNFWFWVQTGCRLDDTQTGFRLYPLHKIAFLSCLTSKYEAELELIVFASWHGVQIVPIPVRVFYPRPEERVSHFRPGKDFARITVLNTVLCFLAVVYGLPLRLWRAMMIVVRTVYSLLFFLFFMLVVITPAVWIYLKIGKMTEKKRYRLHQLIYYASRFVTLRHGIPGTTFKYQVDESVDFNHPHIIICNHQSHLDLMCQLVFTPRVVFLTNDWVYNNPFYGFLIRNAEYVPVVDGLESVLPQLRSLTARGYSVAIYPEGTRSKDCRIGRFHQGAFFLAEELGLDIVPMCLYGPGKILPKKTYHLRKGKFYIEVGKAISRAQLKAMGSWREQASTVRKRFIEKYEAIADRIERDA